jgi:chorismate dehydratase
MDSCKEQQTVQTTLKTSLLSPPSIWSRPTVSRIGAVSYLNSKPLIFGLAEKMEGWGNLSVDLPSRLADKLASGQIDVGLIPVVESFHQADFCRVSDAAIACRGPVWSVRIFFRCDPKQVRSLALDEGSRTSIALSKVLFQMKLGFVPETTPLLMGDDPRTAKADAVLVIGDRAMHPDEFRQVFPLDWDLGELWYQMTGLPFVFAMWVARTKSIVDDKLVSALESARDEGLQNIATISSQASSLYRLTPEQCSDYLTHFIRFHLGEEERRGLDEFRTLCESIEL